MGGANIFAGTAQYLLALFINICFVHCDAVGHAAISSTAFGTRFGALSSLDNFAQAFVFAICPLYDWGRHLCSPDYVPGNDRTIRLFAAQYDSVICGAFLYIQPLQRVTLNRLSA